MRASLQRPISYRPQSRRELDVVHRGKQPASIRFVPAGWLVMALGIVSALLRGTKVSRLGIARLAWSLTPRTLKIVAAGLVLAATLVVMGAMAALALLALHLT